MNKIVKYSHLEDLPNEILCETFSYLYALDLFYALNNLNGRLTSILKEIYLHLYIGETTSRHQIEFVCEKLIFHCDQVISMDICNESCGGSDIIEYLFEEHKFVNLGRCRFSSFGLNSKLENVLRKLKEQNQLVYFHIDDMHSAETDNPSRHRAHLLSREIVINPPSRLGHVIFQIPYNFPELIDCPMVNSNITNIELNFSGAHNNRSIYVLVYIFRLHQSLRRIRVVFESYIKPGCIYVGNLNLKIVNENDLSRLKSLKEFDLHMMTQCDLNCLNPVLHCMPNLQQFSFTFINERVNPPFIDTLLDGKNWQQMLRNRLPNLIKFDVHMSLLTTDQQFDSKQTLESFRCFVKEYSNWHLSVSRWKSLVDFLPCEHILLRTLNYKCLVKRLKSFPSMNICSNTFETISTTLSSNYHYFQSHINSIEFYMSLDEKQHINCSDRNIPFRNVNHLIIRLSLIKSKVMWFLNSLFASILTNFDADQSNGYIEHLSTLIDLSTVVILEFKEHNNLSESHIAPCILRSCVNVKQIRIQTSLFFSSLLIDDKDLAHIFSRIEKLRLFVDQLSFPSNYVLKIIEHLLSLEEIEIIDFPLRPVLPSIDIFLSHLPKLHHIFIELYSGTSSCIPISCQYVIEKRRQAFGLKTNDKDNVIVKSKLNILNIWIP